MKIRLKSFNSKLLKNINLSKQAAPLIIPPLRTNTNIICWQRGAAISFK
jgi:hypothetical protein